MKPCKTCGKQFRQYKTTDKFCSWNCANKKTNKGEANRARIKPVSDKLTKERLRYRELRKKFLSLPRFCPVTRKPATEIHHMKGRQGYADDWARQNNITLLNDVRFWLAVSREGHEIIEMNPEWAKEKGYSVTRTN